MSIVIATGTLVYIKPQNGVERDPVYDLEGEKQQKILKLLLIY